MTKIVQIYVHDTSDKKDQIKDAITAIRYVTR